MGVPSTALYEATRPGFDDLHCGARTTTRAGTERHLVFIWVFTFRRNGIRIHQPSRTIACPCDCYTSQSHRIRMMTLGQPNSAVFFLQDLLEPLMFYIVCPFNHQAHTYVNRILQYLQWLRKCLPNAQVPSDENDSQSGERDWSSPAL